jgi:hypothetical protein
MTCCKYRLFNNLTGIARDLQNITMDSQRNKQQGTSKSDEFLHTRNIYSILNKLKVLYLQA